MHRLCSKSEAFPTPHQGCKFCTHTRAPVRMDQASVSDAAFFITHTLTTQGRRTKSGGCGNTHFERLQKVTGARQTAQDSSMRSQASSSPRAQTSSCLISSLPCTGEAVRSAQCCILICTLLRSIQQQFSPE